MQQLTQREQVSLLAAAVVIGFYLLFAVIWRPLADMRDTMADTNLRVEESLARVQLMAVELRQLQTGGQVKNRRNLSQLINASTSAQGITPNRIQASGSGSTHIRFEAVSVAGLMRWLHQIESQEGLIVQDASFNQGDRGGLADASIRVSLGR